MVEAILRRAAETGRMPCNCRRAFYDEDGRCGGGCSANQIAAAEEIAQCFLDAIRDQP
jgi:hypothetical protein